MKNIKNLTNRFEDRMVYGDGAIRGISAAHVRQRQISNVQTIWERMVAKTKLIVNRNFGLEYYNMENEVLEIKTQKLRDELVIEMKKSATLLELAKASQGKYNTLPAPKTYHLPKRVASYIEQIRNINDDINSLFILIESNQEKIDKNISKILKLKKEE